MSHPHLQHIAGATAMIVRETGPALAHSVFQLIRLLSEGEPVSVDRFAAFAELPRSEAVATFAELRVWGAGLDDAGNVGGVGLTLVPTPHRYQVGDRTLFTWCAANAPLFPLLLGHTATVASPDPVTGETIQHGHPVCHSPPRNTARCPDTRRDISGWTASASAETAEEHSGDIMNAKFEQPGTFCRPGPIGRTVRRSPSTSQPEITAVQHGGSHLHAPPHSVPSPAIRPSGWQWL